MVKVRELIPRQHDGTVDIAAWVSRIQAYSVKTTDLITRVSEYCQQEGAHVKFPTGESCFEQGLEMAEIVAQLNADEDVIVASIIYPLIAITKLPVSNLEDKLSPAIIKLIRDVQQISLSGHLIEYGKERPHFSRNQSENLRKMLITVIEDVRVVLIKLAEYVCTLSMATKLDEDTKQAIANEVMDIYAPLANRLGIGQIKWELEDLAFRCLQPEKYKEIAKLLDQKRGQRERYIHDVIKLLKSELKGLNIKADVYGRAKHIFSIYRKMQHKNLEYGQIYDIRAVRILVEDVKDCYATLGCVHSLWHHIPKEFDDYIATPKENGYQSLHTAVMGPEGRTLEVQIRTQKMHDEAELGVAAHWNYKEGLSAHERLSLEKKIAWLRQLLEWQSELVDSKEFIDELHAEAFEDRIYIFTPTGEVKDLPKNSTGLDFAYLIHTDVGHQCRGIKVNGKIVPLSHQLRSGETVEVLTNKNGIPSRDWLNPELGYLKSARARAKVMRWFKTQDFEQNLEDGKHIIERELNTLNLKSLSLNDIAKKLNYKDDDNLYAAIGAGSVRVQQVVQMLLRATGQEAVAPSKSRRSSQNKKAMTGAPISDISVAGQDNVLTHIAKCCKPMPGDPVIGYATKSRGITIHKFDCPNLFEKRETANDRIIEVQWNTVDNTTYPVDLILLAYDRQGLLNDITNILNHHKINVTQLNTLSDKTENLARVKVTMELSSSNSLSQIIEQLSRIPNVFEISRC